MSPPLFPPFRDVRWGRFHQVIRKPLIMGVLNVTPDSFSGDSLYGDVDAAVQRALRMIEEGADIIDIGGESTRPGSQPVPFGEELARVIPVIERLSDASVPISVDTSKGEVAARAIDAGASIINDVTALRGSDSMLSVLQSTDAGVVLMHMQGTPATMQDQPHYRDVVDEVVQFLQERAHTTCIAGIVPERVMVDPGIGFGKTVENNVELLRNLERIAALGYPVVVGTSRKSFIGALTGASAQDRTYGTAASVALAIAYGADIVRVHDVKEMKQVVQVTDAIVRRYGG